MHRTIMAVLVVGACVGLSRGAEAMPLPVAVPAVAGSATLVDGGCGGPEFFRAPNGVCYRKRYGYGYAPPPPPPAYYGRGCGYGFHPTPYGCRPNY